MKITKAKFYQAIQTPISNDYTMYLEANDTISMEFENNYLTILFKGLNKGYIITTGNIEKLEFEIKQEQKQTTLNLRSKNAK